MRRVFNLICWLGLVLPCVALAQEGFGDPRALAGKYADFALSDNDRSFTDRTDPVLDKWVSNTIENIIELKSVNRAEASVTIFSLSARITVTVPMGWYAIDDGERAAIFTADETVRLILRPVDLTVEGVQGIGDYAQVKRGLLIQQSPKIKAYEVRLGPDMVMNVYENVPPRTGDKTPRTIFDIITANPKDPKRANLMTFGVPDGQGSKYLPLLGAILRDRKNNW